AGATRWWAGLAGRSRHRGQPSTPPSELVVALGGTRRSFAQNPGCQLGAVTPERSAVGIDLAGALRVLLGDAALLLCRFGVAVGLGLPAIGLLLEAAR